jgi:glycosyltransferase involved in cell wall biosynthesis
MFDEIWCKTRQAETIFNKLLSNKNDVSVRYIGWTSIDRHSLKHKKKYDEYLHVAGKSIFKGTQSIINNWDVKYPTLHLVYNKSNLSLTIPVELTNIKTYPERLDDDELIRLMNTCAIHLCPSEAEGFGHYLNEARSCSSIVITTDAEPMNMFSSDPYLIKVGDRQELGGRQQLGGSTRRWRGRC